MFAIDVPGHGSSSWTPGNYTWDTVGTHLAAFLEKVVRRPAIVAGNSSGGIHALWLASEVPDAVAGIVLEDAPVFSTEWPRFRDRDRFVYGGLVHAVEVLERPDRNLADYFRGQELPVTERRTKRFPAWAIDRLLTPGVRRWEATHPGEPSGFQAWWAPATFGDFFRSLSMFDPDFARAFVDGRMYGDFSHADALRALRCPVLLMHANWMRIEPYGLVGALDADDVRRVQELAPQTRVEKLPANHVVHKDKPRDYARAIREWSAGF